MADYAVTEQEKKLYAEITDRYRDSLLLVNKDNLLVYTLISPTSTMCGASSIKPSSY